MNKSTKTALRQMRKDELVEFTWNLVQHYNEISREKDFLDGIAKTRWSRTNDEPNDCWDDRMFLLHKIGDWNSKMKDILESGFDEQNKLDKNAVWEIWEGKDRYSESFSNNWSNSRKTLIRQGFPDDEQTG